MFMELFAHALHLWSTRRPADRTAMADLSEELSRLCGPSTNIYGIDMRPDDPMAFGFDELLGNVDLEGGGPTLGDYPDRQYILRDVLPHYRLVRDTGDPDVRNLRSAIQDKVAVYDRLILPVGNTVRRPRRALVLSHVRLVLPLPREHARLSRREREILELLTLGLSAKEIGRALGTSNRTVEHQIGSIRDKLGARNLAHAVSLAIAQDLCRPSVLSPSLPRPAGRIASPAFTWRRPALS
jgi:DNA-binding CsgD family transcriptional regulator